MMVDSFPVFYDCEASSLDGFPIEIGWAFVDREIGQIQSEAHLIKPASTWDLVGLWDPEAQALHGISVHALMATGRPPVEIAARMNAALAGAELVADDSKDEGWVRQLFDAAGLDPGFTISRTNANALTTQAAQDLGWDAATYEAAKRKADALAPHVHRAEADARHWATLWQLISQSRS